MEGQLRRRFWVEVVMTLLSSALFLITILWNNWIETVFGVDPDQNSGSLEWLIVVLAFAITVASATLARREWRRRQLLAA